MFIVIAVILFAVGIIYLTMKANDLPSFIPGATSPKLRACGGDLQPPDPCFRARTYSKRGIAAIGLGVVFLVAAWYTSGLRKSSTPAPAAGTDPAE